QPARSVTGEGHWGGGMFINAYDMARFSHLTLRRGKWDNRQLLSKKWMNMALTPTGCNRPTGSSTISSILTANSGQVRRSPPSCHMVYVDPENELVAVVRWIDNNAVDGFLKRLIAAVAEKS